MIHGCVVADYDQKAEDAVDYEDIQEQYEGPEVQLALQDMQFYAEAALAGPTKLVEEDNYDEEDDFDSEQRTEAKAADEDFDSEQHAEAKAEDEDFESEQPAETKLESPVKTASGMLPYSFLQMFLYHAH